jgi:phosphoglucosamine mutase
LIGMKYFGTDGIRGRVGSGLITPMMALKLGWAAGSVLSKEGTKTVLIGKDTRVSGYLLESALEAGLSSAGVHSKLLGPMPTPAIAYLTHTFRADAGIVISASHNPYYDNGIKFFGPNGKKLDLALEAQIEAEMAKEMTCVPSIDLGKAQRIDNASGRYIEYCKSHLPLHMSLKGLKVVVDCAHGATYHIAPNVFHELGAEVVSIGVSPNGFNINDNCGATATDGLCQEVVRQEADLGIALDGDGDRIIMVDKYGHVVDGDSILYILAKDAHLSGVKHQGVVGTVMSNQGLEVALNHLGIDFLRAQVGDKYVSELLSQKQWSIGGESSGHILHLQHGTTGDGIVAGVLVCKAMLRQNKQLNEMLAGYKKMPQTLINIKYNSEKDLLKSETVIAAQKEVESKLKQINGRLLIRKSGTEPLIRIMVESFDQEKNEFFADFLSKSVLQADQSTEVVE